MIFMNEMRPKVNAENPELKMTEVAKKVGGMWTALSEEDKTPFKEKARFLLIFHLASFSLRCLRAAPWLPSAVWCVPCCLCSNLLLYDHARACYIMVWPKLLTFCHILRAGTANTGICPRSKKT